MKYKGHQPDAGLVAFSFHCSVFSICRISGVRAARCQAPRFTAGDCATYGRGAGYHGREVTTGHPCRLRFSVAQSERTRRRVFARFISPTKPMAKTNDGFPLQEAFEGYGYSIIGTEELGGLDDGTAHRGRGKLYGADRTSEKRMCQTEVSLRLGRHLAESPLLVEDVYLKLGGAELTRRDEKPFDPASYMSRWGYTKGAGRAEAKPPWIGFYTHKRHQRKLLLNFDKFDAHIMAFLKSGRRLIVHCAGGDLTGTRSPVEVHELNRLIGRAVGWYDTKPDDVIAVCTPRTERFRKMTTEKSRTVGVQRAGVRFFHVDRGGGVTGLGEDLIGG